MEFLEVLSEIIHKMGVIDWIALVIFLIYCSSPFWKWLEFKLDVKDFGEEVAREIHKDR